MAVKKNFIDHTTHELIEVVLPACPVCGSTASRCHRPSQHEAMEWHLERELLLVPLIGWADWEPGVSCDDELCKDACEAAEKAGIKLG